MNVGFYVDNLGNELFAVDMLKKALEEKSIAEGVIFYNNPSDSHGKDKTLATFNATDVWSFTGLLICTNIPNVVKVSQIVNNFSVVYFFNKGERNVFNLMKALELSTVVVETKDDQDYIKRVAGVEVPVVGMSITKILEITNDNGR